MGPTDGPDVVMRKRKSHPLPRTEPQSSSPKQVILLTELSQPLIGHFTRKRETISTYRILLARTQKVAFESREVDGTILFKVVLGKQIARIHKLD